MPGSQRVGDPQHLLQMAAQGAFRHCRPPFKHGTQDRPVLLDQHIDQTRPQTVLEAGGRADRLRRPDAARSGRRQALVRAAISAASGAARRRMS